MIAIHAVKMKFISPSKHAIIGKAEIKPYKWALLQILSPSLWSNLWISASKASPDPEQGSRDPQLSKQISLP